MADYKSIVVKNNTTDKQVTLFIYKLNDRVCWLSYSSVILTPGSSHLHRSNKGFKYKINTNCKKSKKTVMCVTEWTKDMYIEIDSREKVTVDDLGSYEDERIRCIRKLNLRNEASLDEGRNLYEILKLNFTDVRNLEKENQDEIIKNAYLREICRWHTDIAGEHGDNEMAHEVMVAYEILGDRAKRAKYHNRADYSNGWLSKSKWKSVFLTECENEHQQRMYDNRLDITVVSTGFSLLGLSLGVLSAGAASPVVAAVSGIYGASFVGGGLQGLSKVFTRESIEEGCDKKKHEENLCNGCLAGAVTGGAFLGITAKIAGIGSSALQASSLTSRQLMTISVASGATVGTVSSLAADAEKKIVDGVDLSLKQVVGHAAAGCVIGVVTGTAVWRVSGIIGGMSTEVSSTNIKGILRKVGTSKVGKKLSRTVTEKTTETTLGSMTDYTIERLDDQRENRPVGAHLKDAGIKVLTNVAIDSAICTCAYVGKKVPAILKEKIVGKPVTNGTYAMQALEQPVGDDLDQINNTKQPNLQEYRVRASYISPAQSKEHNHVHNNDNSDHFVKRAISYGRFRHVSKGLLVSKMIVEYKYQGEIKEKNAQSGHAIEIPIKAEHIKVYFKVFRFINTWCNVSKWDRFKKKWCNGSHIFKYQSPPEQRTFILDGTVFYGITNVTDEKHDDVNDM